MLRTASPNISVITNFGCGAGCWYCIWKGHPLENVRLETDWDKLDSFLYEYKDREKVSVSGGGDCLYKYDQYVGWWIKFFELTEHHGLLVDVHTREQFTHQSFWRKHINRCVFSSDRLSEDIKFLRYVSKLCKVRITHLVTADTTMEMIEEYLEFQGEISCQFTIKELIGFSDNGMYGRIREKYPEIFSLDAGDYNVYYMPDNTIKEQFYLSINLSLLKVE